MKAALFVASIIALVIILYWATRGSRREGYCECRKYSRAHYSGIINPFVWPHSADPNPRADIEGAPLTSLSTPDHVLLM